MQTTLAEFPKASPSYALGAFDWRVIHGGLGCTLVNVCGINASRQNPTTTLEPPKVWVFPYEIFSKNVCKSRGDSDVFLCLPC